MTEAAATPAGLPESARPGHRGLKGDAIGFGDSLSIGLASTAPAYSLAAVLGTVVLGLGVQAPAALLVAFVPAHLHTFRVVDGPALTAAAAVRLPLQVPMVLAALKVAREC